MVRYTIKLTKSEVEKLETVINKRSHKSQKYRAAYILLNNELKPWKVQGWIIPASIGGSLSPIRKMCRTSVKSPYDEEYPVVCIEQTMFEQAYRYHGEIRRKVCAWQDNRNNKLATINWQFTSKDARIKLKRLHPSFND